MIEKTEFESGTFYLGDCFEVMAGLEAGSIDMVLNDPPYGTTSCAWDSLLPLERMWDEYWRVIKANAAVVITASQPFTTTLIASQIKKFKYCWVWEKSKVSGFTNAKNKPLNTYEDICVFSEGTCANRSLSRMPYHPQGLIRHDRVVKNSKRDGKDTIGNRPSRQGEYFQEFTNYPKNILKIPHDTGTFHPTQKPVALFEYLIRTYTNEGMTVLDNTAGSGTTAIAAMNAGRRWVCIEKGETYYRAAVKRVRAHELKMKEAA